MPVVGLNSAEADRDEACPGDLAAVRRRDRARLAGRWGAIRQAG